MEYDGTISAQEAGSQSRELEERATALVQEFEKACNDFQAFPPTTEAELIGTRKDQLIGEIGELPLEDDALARFVFDGLTQSVNTEARYWASRLAGRWFEVDSSSGLAVVNPLLEDREAYSELGA